MHACLHRKPPVVLGVLSYALQYRKKTPEKGGICAACQRAWPDLSLFAGVSSILLSSLFVLLWEGLDVWKQPDGVCSALMRVKRQRCLSGDQ